MKHKLLTILLSVVLFSSVFAVALADVCPRCHGTGNITENQPCPTCGGATSNVAGVTLKRTIPGDASSGSHLACRLEGIYHNGGTEDVYGTVTATVKKSSTEAFTNTSPRTLFRHDEDTSVTIMVDGINFQPYYSCLLKLNADCPTCGGTGFVPVSVTCPDCGGTGVVSGFASLTNFEGVTGPIIGVVVVGAVVATAFVLIKEAKSYRGESSPPYIL